MKVPLPLAPLRPLSSALVRSIALAGGGLLVGQWLLNDLLHVPGGGLGLLAVGSGVFWLSRRSGQPRFEQPTTVEGWIERCRVVLDQFEAFDVGSGDGAAGRRCALQTVLDRKGPLRVALVCVDAESRPEMAALQRGLSGPYPMDLSLAHPLQASMGERQWPTVAPLSEKLVSKKVCF